MSHDRSLDSNVPQHCLPEVLALLLVLLRPTRHSSKFVASVGAEFSTTSDRIRSPANSGRNRDNGTMLDSLDAPDIAELAETIQPGGEGKG